MITIIITAYHEEKNITNLLSSILLPSQENIPKEDFEIMLVCPDRETLNATRKYLNEINFDMLKFTHLKDMGTGKPDALNLAFDKALGEIVILTDGDVVQIGKGSLPLMISSLRTNPNVVAVTARVKSVDRKNNFWGYIGHLLADAAHTKRQAEMNLDNNTFYVLSGYLSALYKPQFRLPSNILSDDAYISYKFKDTGKYLVYEPDASVYVKYPTNISDWYLQKVRSLGGYIQLKKISPDFASKNTRTIGAEFEFLLFPIKYASNLQEIMWSLRLYPLRLYLWVKTYYTQLFSKKSFDQIWKRVESTK